MLYSGAGQSQRTAGEGYLKHRVVTRSREGHCERTKHTSPLLMFTGQSKALLSFLSFAAGVMLELALHSTWHTHFFIYFSLLQLMGCS